MLGALRSIPAVALVLAAVLAAALAGCVKEAEDASRVVAGDVEWARPANEFLQVQILSPLGLHTVVDFPQSEWHVAGIADAISRGEISSARVLAEETGLFEEVRAVDAEAPDALSAFRLDRVQAARAEQGEPPLEPAALEEEWEERLDAIERGDAPAVTVVKPGASVPAPRVPAPAPPRAPATPPPESDASGDEEEGGSSGGNETGSGDEPQDDAEAGSTLPDFTDDATRGASGALDPNAPGGAQDPPLEPREPLAEDDPPVEDSLANETLVGDAPTVPAGTTGLLGS